MISPLPVEPADAAVGPPPIVPGRTVITDRALTRTFAAIAAAELGVHAGEPDVRVHDDAGRLGVRIVSPIVLATDPDGTRTALEIATATRDRVHADGSALTGAQLAPVQLRLASASRREARRVR